MPILEVALTVKQDGVMLPNLPLVRRISVVESELLNFQQPSSASFVAVPGLPLSAGQAIAMLMLTADQTIAVHANGQTVGDAGIVLNPGGLLILIDSNLTASLLAAIQNNSGNAANIKGLAAGT